MRAFGVVPIPASESSLALECFQIVHCLHTRSATHLAGGLQTGADGGSTGIAKDHAAVYSVELNAAHASGLSKRHAWDG